MDDDEDVTARHKITFNLDIHHRAMPPESSAFSTTDDSAISRTIDVRPDTTASELSAEQFEDFYDIQRTADEIIQGDYRRVRFHQDERIDLNSFR